jgi:hypothetical protein
VEIVRNPSNKNRKKNKGTEKVEGLLYEQYKEVIKQEQKRKYNSRWVRGGF